MPMFFGPVGGGGGGGLLPTQAIVENATTITLSPASGTTPAQGVANVTVADNVATFRLAANRVALTTGATAPVQNSAGAAIGTGAITIGANAITHIRLPATIGAINNGGSVSVRNSAGADAHTATAIVASGVLTGVNLAATAAMIDNGDTVTATGGQQIDVAVAAGVASYTVRSFPFWDPFTITAGDLTAWGGGTAFGYAAGVAGSITNEPLDGYTVMYAYTDADGFHMRVSGPRPLADQLAGGVMGISAIDYPLDLDDGDYGVSAEAMGGGVYETLIYLDVPIWTLSQQVPVVTMPWVAS